MEVDKKLFFHFSDMTILNSFLLLTACGTKMTHKDFRPSLLRNLIERAGSQPRPRLPQGRPCVSQKQVTQLEVNFSSHWPYPSSKLCCRVCSARPGGGGGGKRVQFNCKKWVVGVCLGESFEASQTK
jgi:hypothetical protein